MNYFLYQLQFSTPVHFGGSDSALSLYHSEDHFLADTLFSALCHTALQFYGINGINRLINLAQAGGLLLSDSMPWQANNFYLPKPIYTANTAVELPADKRKALKKLKWIAVESFDDYCHSLLTGDLFEAKDISFGIPLQNTKAYVPEIGDAKPYPVGLFCFQKDSGLYFIIAFRSMEDHDWFSSLLAALGITGIGGKVSSGYGKFSVVDEIYLNEPGDCQKEWLLSALTQKSPSSMLLTSSLPIDEELEKAMDGAYYQLSRRSGFIASSDQNMIHKKKTQYFLSAGSVLSNRFSGSLYDVGSPNSHSVYRYSIPIFMGVNL